MKLIMRSSYRHSTTLAGSKMRANCMSGKIIGQAFLAAKTYHINIPFSATINGNCYARSWKLHRQSSFYHLVLPYELRMKKDGSIVIRGKITKKDEKVLLKRTDVWHAPQTITRSKDHPALPPGWGSPDGSLRRT